MAFKVSSSHLTSHTGIITPYTEQNKPTRELHGYNTALLKNRNKELHKYLAILHHILKSYEHFQQMIISRKQKITISIMF